MPLDEIIGEGCIKLLFRFLFEILFEWFGHIVWIALQYIGASVVWVITFGRVWMLDEHENWAGVLGLLIAIALGVCLFRVFGS
ncbi:MAG TPA: hypothetical protein VLE43_18110 [Candidatus Saccharimonadia bacterium]|nr:hypothetical protein [Candidatus Saccharimonadia bacterium]